MTKIVLKYNSDGFTLIEVMVSLLIVATVLTSAFSAIMAFANQRTHMSEKINAQSIAWNELMMRYQSSNGWIGDNDKASLETTGVVFQNGLSMNWVFEQQAALGRGVYKQTVSVYNSALSTPKRMSSMVLFQSDVSQQQSQHGIDGMSNLFAMQGWQ